MKRHYFDYAASTPVDPRVEKAMRPYFLRQYGNPGSLHGFGQEAIAAVDAAREAIAASIGASFREIVFTGSATEANNLALRGAVAKWKKEAGHRGLRPRIVIGVTEHESVLETARALERDEDAEVMVIPVDKEGIVDLAALRGALNERTVLVSVMHANNEIGTVQPIAEIARLVAAARHEGDAYPLMHTDAVQAFQFFACDARELGIDLMTLSAHKIYGPKGIGVLYVREQGARDRGNASPRDTLDALIAGGGQEFGVRSGTENVPIIVGFGKAAGLAAAMRAREAKRIAALKHSFIKGIKKISRKIEVNGATGSGALPNIVNIYIPGHSAEDIIIRMDLAGLAIAAGSACRARAVEPSHVIRALGYGDERARSSVRISFGRATTSGEAKKLLETFSKIIA